MEWRAKTYYEPRVLIEVSDVLDCPFPDTLICLTGAEQGLLRNLCQYLHRTATFVSEYRETDYLAPTEEEWDVIQALVAELEEKLMGCTEIEATLEAMTLALQCLCEKTGLAYPAALTTPEVEYYLGQQTLQWPDPYPYYVSAEDPERCAIGQLTYRLAYEILTEIVQPAQDAAWDIFFPAVLALVVLAIGSPVALLPAGTIYLVVDRIVDAWVEGQLENVINELETSKPALVCAIYDALGISDFRAAESACKAVIDAMAGASPIDKLVFRALFAPWAFGAVQKAWVAQTAWALGNVIPGYCADCAGYATHVDWEFPPCPGTWTLDREFCNASARPQLGTSPANQYAYSEPFLLEVGAHSVIYHVLFYSSSRPNPGWNVALLRLQQYNPVTLTWGNVSSFASQTIQTTATYPALNDYSQAPAFSTAYELCRFRLEQACDKGNCVDLVRFYADFT